MATKHSAGVEFLKLKVFLYKYTPKFTLEETAQGNLFKIDRYSIDLDEDLFSKYDISTYVTGYTFDQSILDNTFTWTLNLQESIITYQDLDKLRLVGPALSRSTLGNLAEYESQSSLLEDATFIETAKLQRGQGQAPMIVKLGRNLPEVSGLRLSDLIQPYDIVSVFLYKSNTPLESLLGTVKIVNGVRRFVQSASGRQIRPEDLQDENILLTPDATDPYKLKTLFSNEFNGFVMRKFVTRRPGSVDALSISGNGLSRLFGSTRKLLKGSLLQKSIYDIGEIVNPNAFTPYQNVYVGKTLEEIFADLFNVVYRIKFDSKPLKATVDLSSGGFASLFNKHKQFTGLNYFDISSLVVGNALDLNQFTVPPYLMALTMKRRGFNYKMPAVGTEQELINTVDASRLEDGSFNQALIDKTVSSASQLSFVIGTSPVFFSKELDVLRPYFAFIEEVFRFFNAELSTPFEIIDEIKSKTFLEFYERYDGQMIVRAPQYNDRTNVLFSTNLDIIETSYAQTVENQVSRQSVGYGTDVIGKVEAIQAFIYTNGKLLKQFGFLESGTDINPNVKNDQSKNSTQNSKRKSGLFKYAQYFLEIHNAVQKSGSMTINLDPLVSVGRTLFDETNKTFSYITRVSKSVQISGNATMNLELSYVRDCYLEGTRQGSNLKFYELPRLVDIAEQFSTTQTGFDQVFQPEPTV